MYNVTAVTQSGLNLIWASRNNGLTLVTALDAHIC